MTAKPCQTVRNILLDAPSFAQALADMFHLKKEQTNSFSLANLGRRLEMKSRGALSEILRGKRKFPKRHLPALAKTFELAPLEEETMRLLWEKDHAKDSSSLALTKKQLAKTRKVLHITFDVMNPQLNRMFFAFKVFAAFGLFRHSPTREQLVSYFGNEHHNDVIDSLEHLQAMGMIQEAEGVYEMGKSIALFTDSEDGLSHRQFLKQMMGDAMQAVDKWFDIPERSRFHSTLMSVKRSQYETYIKDLRSKIIEDQSQLEQDNGDFLIHYNVQVYPASPHLHDISACNHATGG